MQLEELYSVYLSHPVISTDTRNLPRGCIFFALRGERFNANEFALEAIRRGASYAVVDDEALKDQPGCFFVDNVLAALQQLARHHRLQFKIPFIAVCGSNGKTTTKELIHSVLSTRFRTVATKGNLNNHIGVPLTLLSIPTDTEIAVIEMGANHIGETAELCAIALPDFGLVTNNGKDHLEGFGSIEGVRTANGELFQWLRMAGGWAFVNDQHDDLMMQSEGLNRKIYGGQNALDFPFSPLPDRIFAGIKILPSGLEIESKLAGSFNWENLATAAAIGLYFGVEEANIKSAIGSYIPAMNRSQVVQKFGATLVVDCYNANPSSMKVSLESFEQLPNANKAVILGDMLELGVYSDKEHEEIVNLVSKMNFQKVILIGKEFGKYKNGVDSLHFNSSEDAKQWFHSMDWSGWAVLLKGSRGYRLEKILET